jgi:hypothetical protein
MLALSRTINLNRIIIGTAFFAVAMGAILYNNRIVTKKTVVQPLSHLEALSHLETTTWNKVATIVGISQEYCLQHREELFDLEDKDQKGTGRPVSQENKNLIVNVLRDFNVDPATIRILPYDHKSPAGALETVLFVNESIFNTLSKQGKKFVIGHELQHMIHKDSITRRALEILTENKKSSQAITDTLNGVWRYHEYRADIKAALKNREYAQGYLEFVQTLSTMFGENAGITHPKNSRRLAIADQILTSYDRPTEASPLVLA